MDRGLTNSRVLVTGGAGFIGSHLIERLLNLGQRVRCVDDFSTGLHSNIDAVRALVGEQAFARFDLLEGDLADDSIAQQAVQGMDLVLHQAALGSVPRSIKQPLRTYRANVLAFCNLLESCRMEGIKRVVFASSSSVYGDEPNLPKYEARVGHVLSPYAASKMMDELWAESYSAAYPMTCVGLRYFNVFGPRQRPDGPYAAVIPRWIASMAEGRAPMVFGDGEQSRDFTPIELVVQTNITAAMNADIKPDRLLACNVALGGRLSLNQLEGMLRAAIRELLPQVDIPPPEYLEPRAGDVRHSQADITNLQQLLGALPRLDLPAAMAELCRHSLQDPSAL